SCIMIKYTPALPSSCRCSEGAQLALLPPEEKSRYDPTAQAGYREACRMLGVIPVSCFLRNMQQSELSLVHHGLGPQGTAALAVPLVTNTFILKLNLRDNWMEGVGGAAVADMLKENCYITVKSSKLCRKRMELYSKQNMFSILDSSK
uniref:Leucine rich repeat containing 74B n=1 Tax=Astyanax mexicanus TaxID=7994 RepID=A0A8B9JAY1_ASTMX